MKPLVLLLWLVCSVSLFAASAKDGLILLTDPDAFPKNQQAARMAVVMAVSREGLKPGEYYVQVEAGRKEPTLEFQLWHVSALKQRNDPRIKGDPSGKCRTVVYDLVKKAVTRIYGWR